MRQLGRRPPELMVFAGALGALLAGFFAESLLGGKVLSPADVLRASAAFRPEGVADYEPSNRLLMDPVLQFQPWLAFNRELLRKGRLPVWNGWVGCGAPHLANGQNGVFDPFHVIAYVGTLPEAFAWMAWARLWVAGLGMFLLARSWGFGGWGRWFCGLVFPLCGFLMVWLLFPVTSVAVWMPWLFLATDRLLERRNAVAAAGVAIVVGLVLLGGHIQTSAHVLLAAGLYVGWRMWPFSVRGIRWSADRDQNQQEKQHHDPGQTRSGVAAEKRSVPRALLTAQPGHSALRPGHTPRAHCRAIRQAFWWLFAVCWGIAIGAIVVIPLAVYLGKSPVWSDRQHEKPSPWQVTKPRLLDALCTAFPYAFGSQRRGQPNLARALGVHNLNESAGGFSGVATLLWLAPLGFWIRRRDARVRFLAILGLAGFLGAFGWPPVVNLLRALPVLDVADNRRLTLWTAFGLVLLGGIGLDHLAATRQVRWLERWAACWMLGAVAMVIVAASVGWAHDWLSQKAIAHYARAAAETPGADPAAYRVRAERQVAQSLAFMPRYLLICASELGLLAALVVVMRRRQIASEEETRSVKTLRSHAERGYEGARACQGESMVRAAVLVITLAELLGFGHGLNPAIPREEHQLTSPVITYLQHEVGSRGRILGVGSELIPNTAMRFGLADVRNYDSIELKRSLDWLAPLYEPGASASTSRRTVTWAGALRAIDQLKASGVQAIVAASAPPTGRFHRVDRVGNVWVARVAADPIVRLDSGRPVESFTIDHDIIKVRTRSQTRERLCVAHTFDGGWRAAIDGKRAPIEPERGAFLALDLPAGPHEIALRYRPGEVRIALGVSLGAGAAACGTWMIALLFRPKSTWTRRRARVTIDSRDLHRTSQPAYS